MAVSATQSNIQEAKALSIQPSGPGLLTNLGNGYDDGVNYAKQVYPATNPGCLSGSGTAYCIVIWIYRKEFR
jgi:hypothetical protein